MDLITDILVMTEYYTSNKREFFVISLVVVLFAQLSYCVAFVIKHTPPTETCASKFSIFLFSMPFAPIMSFIFFMTVKCKKSV